MVAELEDGEDDAPENGRRREVEQVLEDAVLRREAQAQAEPEDQASDAAQEPADCRERQDLREAQEPQAPAQAEGDADSEDGDGADRAEGAPLRGAVEERDGGLAFRSRPREDDRGPDALRGEGEERRVGEVRAGAHEGDLPDLP